MQDTFINLPEAKQERILNVALLEFASYGYDNASTNRIIKNLGISKGSLFKYFASKLDLYNDLVQYTIDRLLKHLDQANIDCSSIEKGLLSYAASEFDFLISYPLMYRFFYTLIQQLDLPALQEIKESITLASLQVQRKMFTSLNLDSSKDALLITHIGFILLSYNQSFLQQINTQNADENLKHQYLDGLQAHIKLIRWNNHEQN